MCAMGKRGPTLANAIFAPTLTPMPVDGVYFHELLDQLPKKADMVNFRLAFLRINSELGEILPVVSFLQDKLPDPAYH